MKISTEGYTFIITAGIAAIILFLLFIIEKSNIIGITLGIVFIIFLLMLYFFRDPDRKTPMAENSVLSAADGTIVNIEEVYEKEYLKDKGIMVSIFLTLFDIHVNRIPVSGTVEYLQYRKGKFHPALFKKSSTDNENYAIGINTGEQKVFFKQIAGILARRIVNRLEVGERVKTGNRFGIIKFGSRVDIVMPAYTEIKVKNKQKVIGGETIIGVLKNEKNSE